MTRSSWRASMLVVLGLGWAASSGRAQQVLAPVPAPPAPPRGWLSATGEGGQTMDMPLVDEELTIDVDAQQATARLQQTYHNPSAFQVEGLYALDAGPGTRAEGFAYWNGEEKIVGEVFERETARQVYEIGHPSAPRSGPARGEARGGVLVPGVAHHAERAQAHRGGLRPVAGAAGGVGRAARAGGPPEHRGDGHHRRRPSARRLRIADTPDRDQAPRQRAGAGARLAGAGGDAGVRAPLRRRRSGLDAGGVPPPREGTGRALRPHAGGAAAAARGGGAQGRDPGPGPLGEHGGRDDPPGARGVRERDPPAGGRGPRERARSSTRAWSGSTRRRGR